MADKINKIREWVSYKQDSLMDEDGYFEYPEDRGAYNVLSELDDYIDSMQEEPVSEDLEDVQQTIIYNGEIYTRCYKDKLDAFACKYPTSVPKTSKKYAKYSDVDLTIAIKAGAKWQKGNLWKPADGDDLPEIDREVIVLLNNGRVAFGHRLPEYWDGKNIITGKVTRNYPKTYDKGGWNIPDAKYWLDVELPKEIEL